MVALVVSDNLIQLFFGWEGVGLASYLLIVFDHKKSVNLAAMKAFLVNRVAVGLIGIYIFLDTLSINEIVQNRDLPLFQIDFFGFSIDTPFACFFIY